MPSHYIPEKLIAVARAEREFKRAYTNETYRARPAFIVPEGSKMINTARLWAKHGGRWHSGNFSFTEEVLDNAPMTRLRVVGLEHRAKGGMAYKVVTPQGYLVDLREEEFLTCFFEGRIDRKGYLEGEFVWSVGGNQMRLVEVGSALYNERLKKGQARREKTAYIKGKDLEVGVRYRHASGYDYWYAGRVRHNGKLKYGWWDLYNHSLVGTRRILIVTGSSTAVSKSPDQEPCPDAVISEIMDGHGYGVHGEVTWADGTEVKVWGRAVSAGSPCA